MDGKRHLNIVPVKIIFRVCGKIILFSNYIVIIKQAHIITSCGKIITATAGISARLVFRYSSNKSFTRKFSQILPRFSQLMPHLHIYNSFAKQTDKTKFHPRNVPMHVLLNRTGGRFISRHLFFTI